MRDPERPRVLVKHDPAAGVWYYRQNDPANPPLTRCDLGVIDWLLLAEQKQALLALIWEDGDSPLWGLVDLLDAIQDGADAQDFPVVWATAEWEG